MPSPEDFGAVGDGTSDDTTAIQNMINTGGGRLTRGATYKITSALSMIDNSFIIGDRSSTIYMPAASFNNTSALSADRYKSNSCGILAQGGLTGPFTPIANVLLQGFRIQYESTNGRVVDAIAGRNGTRCRFLDLEITGFNTGVGIRLATFSYSNVQRNYIHDFADDTNFGAVLVQITGIEVDNDIVNSTASTGMEITNNTIVGLTMGSTGVAAHGYQTDGITIANPGSSAHVISGNIIRVVGEGIDCFGTQCVISGNVITNCHYYGTKLIHGASFNTVSGNTIAACGIFGIVISGTTSQTITAEGNLITGNTVSVIDPGGTFSASETACLATTDNGATTYKPTGNIFSNNMLRPGNGKYAIVRGSTSNNFWIDNYIQANGVTGGVSSGTETGTINTYGP